MFKEFFKDAKTFWAFITRNVFWIILAIVCMYSIDATTDMLKVILASVLFECLAIGLSNFAHFIFTRLNFTKDDTPHTAVLGYIFLGVHILIGLIGFGAYFIQFSGKPF